MRWLISIVLSLVWIQVAAADPPKGYKCGPGGYRVKDACRCPDEKRPARDADDKAICEPKPEPAATACLADRKGKHAIKIEGNPVGATIFLGSKDCPAVGKTPWSGKLAAGPVNIILEHQGYEPETKTVTIVPKIKTAIFMILPRTNAGNVDVKADADPNVAGAPVTLDGQPVGNVPVSIKKVKAGRHVIDIQKPGFDPFQQWIEVQDGQTMMLMPVLRAVVPGKARLVIDADVVGAEVFVNGERKGTAPMALDGLPLGTYTIEVKKAGSKDWSQKVTLTGGTTLLRAELAATIPKGPTDGVIEVVADVPGTEVLANGAVVGKAPIKLTLPAGDHWIQVKLAGRMTYEKKLTLEAGKEIKISAVMVPSAKLEVSSIPAGATVFIDGVRRGTTPLALELPTGEHVVIVERAGYQRFQQKVKLDKPVEITTTLKR
jgi:hypothetical protein